MQEKKYHHGDLRNALIEEGIKLINEEGSGSFSIRQVALRCGVSNAAPYAHFDSKEALLEAMGQHVTQAFTSEMEESYQTALSQSGSMDHAILMLGKCYVMFFVRHPHYFPFLFSQPGMKIDLNMNDDGFDNFPPYMLLRNAVFALMKDMPVSEEAKKDAVISSWALVHGLASIATMKNVSYDVKWDEKVLSLITNAKDPEKRAEL